MRTVTFPSASGLEDPFAATADPSAYVPRAGTERVLAGLEEAIHAGLPCALLVGEAGLGKTLLLRVLEERLRGERLIAYLPYPALPLSGLCAWAGALLGLPAGKDPVAGLLECARSGKHGRPGLLLLLDDMGDLPEQTSLELADLVERSGGGLQVVGAAEPAEACVVADSWNAPTPMRLLDPMTPEELRRYVDARMAGTSGGFEGKAPFDEAGLARLHACSQGVPSLVDTEAARLLRACPPGRRREASSR